MKKLKEKIISKLSNANVISKIEELDTKFSIQNDELSSKVDFLCDRSHFFERELYEKNSLIFDLERTKFDNVKPKILIAGFFGARNMGDELMLYSLLSCFKDKQNIYVMLINNERIIPAFHYDFKYIHYANSVYECELMAELFDVVIWAGGAHIDDRKYAIGVGKMSFSEMYSALSISMIKKDKKVITYGFSSNQKLSNKKYAEHLKFIIENSTYFSLRDNISIKVVRDFCKIKTDIKFDHDLIFSYSDLSKKISVNENNENKENKITLINIYTEESIPKIKKFIKNILEVADKKYKIELLSFYDYCDNDEKYIDEIISTLNSDRVTKKAMPKDFSALLDILGKSKYIISMRYHGILLANLMNKPVLAILYDCHQHYYNKINAMYEMYDFERNLINYNNLDKQKNKIEAFLSKKVKKKDYNKIIEESRKNTLKIVGETNERIK